MKLIKLCILFSAIVFLQTNVTHSMKRTTRALTQKIAPWLKDFDPTLHQQRQKYVNAHQLAIEKNVKELYEVDDQFFTEEPKDEFSSLKLNISYIKSLAKPYEDFITTTSQNKPELLALKHFIDTKAPSGPYVSLSSHDTPLINAIGKYHSDIHMIQLGKEFQNSSPSAQYGVLLHEYRHHLQKLKGAFHQPKSPEATKFYPKEVQAEAQKHKSNPSWLIEEQDADHFAVSHIHCPTCLKTTQTILGPTRHLKGYFSQSDVEPFIQAAEHNPCCPAHSMTPGDEAHNHIVTELEAALKEYKTNPTNELKEKISDLDKKSGTLLQHVPEYNQDLIRSLTQHKEFQENLAAKTIKELDVRRQMEQTAREIQAGKYKLLEAPKPLVESIR